MHMRHVTMAEEEDGDHDHGRDPHAETDHHKFIDLCLFHAY